MLPICALTTYVEQGLLAIAHVMQSWKTYLLDLRGCLWFGVLHGTCSAGLEQSQHVLCERVDLHKQQAGQRLHYQTM